MDGRQRAGKIRGELTDDAGAGYSAARCAYSGMGMYRLAKAEKALADETRLRIVNLLLERECCVCEVMQALGISQTRASRNLGMLYDAGLLKLRREGLWSVYSIDQEGEFTPLVAGLRSNLERDDMARADLERLKRAKRLGPLAEHESVREADCVLPGSSTTERGESCS